MFKSCDISLIYFCRTMLPKYNMRVNTQFHRLALQLLARFLNQGVYENLRGYMVSQQKMIGKNVLHNLEYQYVYTTNLKYVQQLFEVLNVLCKLLSVTMHSDQLILSGFKEHKKNIELPSIGVKCMIGFTCHLFL